MPEISKNQHCRSRGKRNRKATRAHENVQPCARAVWSKRRERERVQRFHLVCFQFPSPHATHPPPPKMYLLKSSRIFKNFKLTESLVGRFCFPRLVTPASLKHSTVHVKSGLPEHCSHFPSMPLALCVTVNFAKTAENKVHISNDPMHLIACCCCCCSARCSTNYNKSVNRHGISLYKNE